MTTQTTAEHADRQRVDHQHDLFERITLAMERQAAASERQAAAIEQIFSTVKTFGDVGERMAAAMDAHPEVEHAFAEAMVENAKSLEAQSSKVHEVVERYEEPDVAVAIAE
jgi:methyl-accepting chemotaxis protein